MEKRVHSDQSGVYAKAVNPFVVRLFYIIRQASEATPRRESQMEGDGGGKINKNSQLYEFAFNLCIGWTTDRRKEGRRGSVQQDESEARPSLLPALVPGKLQPVFGWILSPE